MIRTYQLALAAGAKRLSDVYGDGTGVVNAANDIPYRQLLITSAGAAAGLGHTSGVTGTTGLPISQTATVPVSIGPFPTGPVKLSDFYAAGAGATITVLGVPF